MASVGYKYIYIYIYIYIFLTSAYYIITFNSYIAYLGGIQCGNFSHLQKLKGLCDDIAMALLFCGQVILLTTDIILIHCITMLKMHIIVQHI